MHETGIAKELSAIVIETAGKEKLAKVTRVNIKFGKLVQIVPDIFEFAFREAIRDTIAEDAALDIEVVPVKMNCRFCNNEFQLNENLFKCSYCGSTDIDIVQGKELFIKSIEGE